MSHAQFMKYLVELRASYWFIPSLMLVAAIVLSLITVQVDLRIKDDFSQEISFLFSSQPDGARALLSTVAGSMITVAGVTFSLTLLAVSHSTGQFGPRVLNNFMRDRGNQFTLGTFIATFIYCLLILRTVRSAEEPPVGRAADFDVSELTHAFVPQISITVALLLTIGSVIVLIYFIHHIPESIRLSKVVSGIGKHLNDSVLELFPEMIGSEVDKTPAIDEVLPKDFYQESKPIRVGNSGYMQALDEEGLMRIADRHDLLIFISQTPGDFYCEGKDLLRVWPGEQVDENVEKELQSVFAFGQHRTYSQNVMFAVDQLVEIAQRALSPGVNDPMTAMYCMDWLQSGMMTLIGRSSPDVLRYNKDNQLRVIAPTITFKAFCSQIFDQLRQYVSADRNATVHMLKMINGVRDFAKSDRQTSELNRHADLLLEAAEKSARTESDRQEFRSLHQMGQQRDSESQQKLQQLCK